MPSNVIARRRRVAGALALPALVLVAVAAWLAIDRLTSAKHSAREPIAPAVIVRVLIPEGETRLQIAARAHAAGLRGSYLTASKRSALLDPAHYGAPAGTPNLEGFLFPATYDLYRGDPASRLVHEQLIAFTENFGEEEIRRARELHITPYQLLIVASMVEREAQLPGDRAKVAAVIYNRLRLNMALGIDSTIRYALNDYTQPLDRRPARARLSLQHPHPSRPTADADQQSRRRRDRSRRAPRPRSATSTTWLAPTAAASWSSPPASPGSNATPRPTAKRCARTAGTSRRAGRSHRRRGADAALGSPRLAGRAQPLAGYAQRRPARAGHG